MEGPKLKATIEFNLPEDGDYYRYATNSMVMVCSLESIEAYIRSKLKHGNVSEETAQVLEEINRQLWRDNGN